MEPPSCSRESIRIVEWTPFVFLSSDCCSKDFSDFVEIKVLLVDILPCIIVKNAMVADKLLKQK
jgi:hypothetical protein